MKNPPCKKCANPTIRWGWYEDPCEPVEYWYCEPCDLIQVHNQRWPELERPTKIERFSLALLTEMLRDVRLRGYDIKPYKDSTIELRLMDPMSCVPTQNYLLFDNLLHLHDLREMLSSCHNIDILRLQGFIRLHYKNHCRDILPPIIERQPERTGEMFRVICDGQHRIHLARLEHTMVACISIGDVHRDYPYYAYPRPDRWRNVDVVFSTPPSELKKWHRFYNYKDYYRNFNSVFQNVGDSRPSGVRP